MHFRALLLLAAASLFAADYAAEGKLWWAHIQFLADIAWKAGMWELPAI